MRVQSLHFNNYIQRRVLIHELVLFQKLKSLLINFQKMSDGNSSPQIDLSEREQNKIADGATVRQSFPHQAMLDELTINRLQQNAVTKVDLLVSLFDCKLVKFNITLQLCKSELFCPVMFHIKNLSLYLILCPFRKRESISREFPSLR